MGEQYAVKKHNQGRECDFQFNGSQQNPVYVLQFSGSGSISKQALLNLGLL